MLGKFLTCFIDMVESRYGLNTVDKIISQSKLASNGIYTSIGSYDGQELLVLAAQLSRDVDMSIDDIMIEYGKHFLEYFFKDLAHDPTYHSSLFDFIEAIANIYREDILKRHPDKYLPLIQVINRNEAQITIFYKSTTRVPHFILGILQQSTKYFAIEPSIKMEYLSEDRSEAKFTVINNSEQGDSVTPEITHSAIANTF